jgi:hypothetical protein
MKRLLAVGAAVALLTAPRLFAQCAFAMSGGVTTGISDINFTTLGTPPAGAPAGALGDALNVWAYGCSSGYGFGFPSMTEGPFSSASGTMNVYISFQQTQSPSRCGLTQLFQNNSGQITGAFITMYPTQSDGADCTTDWVNLLAHEIGHVLGLGDAYAFPECTGTIMGNSPSYVGSDQCQLLDNNWYTNPEWSRDTQEGQDEVYCQAYGCSPLVIDLTGDDYALTSREEGVLFDMNGDRRCEPISWTAAGSGVAFLGLDRNGNRILDDGTELFGNHTRSADGTIALNGFDALREFDLNNDTLIDERDPVYSQLTLWIDANHDGFAQVTELAPASRFVLALGLRYQSVGKRDEHGNLLRYQAKVVLRGPHDRPRTKHYYDVFFVQ